MPDIFTPLNVAAALDQAAARYQKIALIVGRPGSGKSALLRNIAQQMNMIEIKCIICETNTVRVCMIITFVIFERVKPENDEKVGDLFRYGSEFLFTQVCHDRSRAASNFSLLDPFLTSIR